jgi:hypothetical protein
MALQQTTVEHRSEDLLRAVLLIAVTVALLVVATAILGMSGSGPSLEIVPDPAGVGLF